ncbi:DUF2460 domain-containing protein [Sandaracinobacter sp. RS1-74]|uniref:DUF2460 domain-containing protein n=1 Tax=Sandaracinobacteroides sayramensis TaxID=2913411 RepID=UPI001EDBF7D4|nr:DUF2460 domain-containing protein [Sandaracinobacteroides sayramensis]MCG2839755.1 DUF2460 domain-containing protein [Sandaracinobacteroides sayramensis]
MGHYLATAADQLRRGWVKRFRPELWTVDFPRPMMATLTAPGAGTLRLDLDFQTRGDLAGLIWESADRWSHPLLAYETRRDYRGTVLAFDWVAGAGMMPLDAVNGAVLTVEGRDAQGVARLWYVRLWNHAVGGPMAARVTLDFDRLRSGFGMDGELVYPRDIDRLFLSLVPADFDGSSTPLALPLSTWVELRNLQATGPNSTLRRGDAFLPEHRMRICSGYDDSYNQAPERLVEQWRALGYRELVTHYVGMSHFPALAPVGGGRFEVSGGLCASATVWHRAFLRALAGAGMGAILSLSFELFDEHAPAGWAQRDVSGGRALTGWAPPSTLLSPCHAGAMDWLRGIAGAFASMAAAEGGHVRFQVGEPWWWVGPSGAPCFYDAATVARWTAEKAAAPPAMADVAGGRSAAERAWLDWLGARLAEACVGVREAARSAAGEAAFTSYLLFYAPQVLDEAKPDLKRANMPVGWAFPAWDVLQLEDYDFVVAGDEWGQARGRAAVGEALGYPLQRQQYFSGFVLDAADAGVAWPRIGEAAAEAQRRGVPEVFLWAWPQVARDGFVWTADAGSGEEAEVNGFHDVRFPLSLGFDAVGGPEFATQVAELVSGHEQRNLLWAEARLRYDAGLGVRSEADLAELVRFFRARRGQAFAFRFRDPLDWVSGAFGAEVAATDQLLGVGDGTSMRFQLVKRYGEPEDAEVRRITRPVGASVRVSVGGVERTQGWALQPGGVLLFEVPPAAGAAVRAGFRFDVPVRFAADRLDVSLSGVRSGEVPSVPLVEVRE